MKPAKFESGIPVEILPQVWRLVAPNAGSMTGPGTNTYLLGHDRKIVIDPGPPSEEHVAAILTATGGGPDYIVVTHTHRDHSPAAALLAAQCEAELIGVKPPSSPGNDKSFVPDREPHDEEILQLGTVSLRCVHTPGHASNHYCYLHGESGALFTGDHAMQGSTVVIAPPDGDMAEYLDSLRKIQALDAIWLAPAHGGLMDEPFRAIERLVRHRLQREARVMDRLNGLGSATLDQLLPEVYSDVASEKFPIARLSLHAHLIKLLADGRLTLEGENWIAPN